VSEVGAARQPTASPAAAPDAGAIVALTRRLLAGEAVGQQPILQGRRLTLAPLALAHIEDLCALDASARVTERLLDAAVHDRQQAAALVVLAAWQAERHPGLGLWHARDAGGHFVGTFSLMPTGSGDAVEIGARLLEASWGRFYAVEGGRLLLEHGFGTLGLASIEGLAHPDNRAAAAVLRRLGFGAQGLTRHLGQTAQRWLRPAGGLLSRNQYDLDGP